MQEDTPVPEAASAQTGMLRVQSASRILSDCFCAAEFCCVSQAWREKQLPHSKCLRQLAILSSCKSGSTGAALPVSLGALACIELTDFCGAGSQRPGREVNRLPRSSAESF